MTDVAYCRSKNGAWHVLVAEAHDRCMTSCGLALEGALVDTLPPKRPRTRPCESCRWPDGYPKWCMLCGQSASASVCDRCCA